MTLIHDYDGDPNATYYDSHYLAPGWLPGYPTYSVHTAEDSYQGDDQRDQGDDRCRTTPCSPSSASTSGWTTSTQTAHEMGDHRAAVRQPVGGDRRSADRRLAAADGRRLRDARQRRRPHPADDHRQGRAPRRQRRSTSATPTPTRVFTQGEAYAGDPGARDGRHQTAPAPPPTTAARPPARPARPATTPTPGSSATRRKLSTAVWVGYPHDTASMTDVNGLGPGFGGTLAAPIWHDYMQPPSRRLLRRLPAPGECHGTGTRVLRHARGQLGARARPRRRPTTTTTTTTPTHANDGRQPGTDAATERAGTTPADAPAPTALPPAARRPAPAPRRRRAPATTSGTAAANGNGRAADRGPLDCGRALSARRG